MALQKFFFFGLISALALSFSACDDDDVDKTDGGVPYPAPANDLCKDAIDLPIDQEVSGTTLGAHSEYQKWLRDVYYKVTIENAGWYEFVLTRPSEKVALAMEIWESCKPASAHDVEHPDVVVDKEFDDENEWPLTIKTELQPGTYLILVDADLNEGQRRISGSDFTISYHAYQATKPEITSAQASFKYVPASGDDSAHSLIAFRISGKDAGKDTLYLKFSLLNAANELIQIDNIPNYSSDLGPKYDANGVFTDAFKTIRFNQDLSSAVKAQFSLTDEDRNESLSETVEISKNFEVISRNAGESCDISEEATSCPQGMECNYDDHYAHVCR